jgi:hypothetical protein
MSETTNIFDDIKHLDDKGQEFWSARELAVALEYKEWRNFNLLLKRPSLYVNKMPLLKTTISCYPPKWSNWGLMHLVICLFTHCNEHEQQETNGTECAEFSVIKKIG